MKVVLLADQGESFAEIAKFLFIDEQTARRHLQDYFDNDKLGGSSGGSEGKLNPEQAARLSAILAACDVASALFCRPESQRPFRCQILPLGHD